MHPAVADDVVDVPVQQGARVQGHVDPRERVDLVGRVQVDAAERVLDHARPGVGEHHVARLVVGLVVQPGTQPAHDLGHLQVGRALARGAREHQRHQRLVDQHRVGLVDQQHVRVRADQVGHVRGEPVAEQVEADLADRRVGHLGRVGGSPLLGRRLLADAADRDAEQVVDRAHPVGVPAGQVVVHRRHLHRPAGQRVPGRGQRAGQRLALAGGHLGHVPVEHDQRAEQLHVERAFAQRAASRLAPDRAELGVVAGVAGQAGQVRVSHVGEFLLARRDRGQQALIAAQVGGAGPLQEALHPSAQGAHDGSPAWIAIPESTPARLPRFPG